MSQHDLGAQDNSKQAIRHASQYEMRFGPRSYTPQQAAVIEQVVKDRAPLSVSPLPFAESSDQE
jgi:hypothetical protein